MFAIAQCGLGAVVYGFNRYMRRFMYMAMYKAVQTSLAMSLATYERV